MDFGLVLQTDPPASAVVDLMQRAEERLQPRLDLRLAVLWQEPFVIHSADPGAHVAADRRPDGHQPGHPHLGGHRLPAATLNEMYGNRTVCGIGRGDSAMRVQGRKPNTLARLAGRCTSSASWPRGARPTSGARRADPVVKTGAAAGLDGRVRPEGAGDGRPQADGFILQLADPYLTEWMVKAVRDAAVAAGRDPDAVTICVAAPAYVGDGTESTRTPASSAAGSAGWSATTSPTWSPATARLGAVPAELTDYIKAREGYDYSHHGRAGNPRRRSCPTRSSTGSA